MTSLYPEQTGVLSNGGNFRRRHPNLITLPQLFIEHGYFAARVGKIFHYGVPNQIGTDGEDDPGSWNERSNPRGLDRAVHDQINSLIPGQFGGTLSWLNLPSSDQEQTDGIGATAAIRLLREHHPDRTGQPFFLAVGFYRPHTPYVAPSKYFDLYDRGKIQPVMEVPGDRDDIPPAALFDRRHQRELTVAQRQEIIEAYYASISYMDAQLGRVLDALDRMGLADRTIVTMVSDHGYHLGRHGLWQKQDLFEGSVHVPMIIAPPKYAQAGSVTKAIAEMVDLYPTLADLCGLPLPGHVRGKSLGTVLDDPSARHRTAAYTVATIRNLPRQQRQEQRDLLGRTVRTDRYRYTEWGADGALGVELYDYQADPVELTNLANDPAHAKMVAELKGLLTTRREEAAWNE